MLEAWQSLLPSITSPHDVGNVLQVKGWSNSISRALRKVLLPNLTALSVTIPGKCWWEGHTKPPKPHHHKGCIVAQTGLRQSVVHGLWFSCSGPGYLQSIQPSLYLVVRQSTYIALLGANCCFIACTACLGLKQV